MKAIFNVAGDTSGAQNMFAPSYEVTVCFNGLPNTVILEVQEITGYSGSSNGPSYPNLKPLMRAPLKSSEARAIASAILSAATEANKKP